MSFEYGGWYHGTAGAIAKGVSPRGCGVTASRHIAKVATSSLISLAAGRWSGPRGPGRAEGEFFIANWGPLGGGWGAKRSEDGVSATVCMNDGDTHNSPIEQAEAKYPVLVEHYRLAQDSGGAGRHRGGLGIDRVVRAHADDGQHPGRPRPLQAVGARGRPRGRPFRPRLHLAYENLIRAPEASGELKPIIAALRAVIPERLATRRRGFPKPPVSRAT
jgi:hypothetical protein